MEIVLVAMIVVPVLLVGWLAWAQSGEPPVPGSVLPAFDLPAAGGGTFGSASIAGRRAVLFFHPQDDTPECIAVVERFAACAAGFAEAGATVQAVVVSDPDRAAAYARARGVGFPVGCDGQGRFVRACGALVNLGFLRFARKLTLMVGADGRVERAWKSVAGPQHVDEVLEAVRAAAR